jgi:catechol 2,3-dioxygenase-like lactoylglutathione lyase family enzyme
MTARTSTTPGTGPDPDSVTLRPAAAPDTGRVQLALNVDDIDEAVAFYSKLFGTDPAKLRPGYANFAVATPPLKLVLLENPGKGGTLNHLGVEVASSASVHSEISRLGDEGLFTDEERGTTCCFATQDKVWVTGPGGERWEGLHGPGRQHHLRQQPADAHRRRPGPRRRG